MQFNPGFSSLAALLADPGRAQMIWALMDGSARPASGWRCWRASRRPPPAATWDGWSRAAC